MTMVEAKANSCNAPSSENDARPYVQNANRPGCLVAGAVVCLVVVGIYNLLFFYRFFPLTEGWFSVYADLILHGRMPYRDFYFFLPPLYPLKIAAFTYLFGPSIFALRVLGFVLALLITLALFIIYSRFFPAYIASISAIATAIYYESNVAYIPYDFLHFCTLYALVSGYLVCVYFRAEARVTNYGPLHHLLLGLSGALSSFAFLTKQSNGFFIVACLTLAVALNGLPFGFRRCFRGIALFAAGVFAPIVLVCSWLLKRHALNLFLHQAFLGGAKAKGTMAAILFGWAPRLLTYPDMLCLAAVVVFVLALRYKSFLLDKFTSREGREFTFGLAQNLILFWCCGILCLLCVALPYANVGLSSIAANATFIHAAYYAVIISTAVGCFLLFVIYATRMVWGRSLLFADIVTILCLSLGLLYGTGTSAAFAEEGAFLGAGLLLGYLLLVRSSYHSGKIVFLCLVMCLLVFMVSRKYVQPYNWWGITENDVRAATESIDDVYLHGIQMSRNTADVVSSVRSIIERYSRPDEAIFTFPNIPIFYLLTGRPSTAFAVVHWFDVLPDKPAADDAQRLLSFPPKIIVSLELPQDVWVSHEKAFRDGKPSGQRKIYQAIQSLTSRPGKYVLAGVFYIPEHNWVKVWRRL